MLIAILVTTGETRMPFYVCWSCGLAFGDDDGLQLPSQSCPNCSPVFLPQQVPSRNDCDPSTASEFMSTVGAPFADR